MLHCGIQRLQETPVQISFEVKWYLYLLSDWSVICNDLLSYMLLKYTYFETTKCCNYLSYDSEKKNANIQSMQKKSGPFEQEIVSYRCSQRKAEKIKKVL